MKFPVGKIWFTALDGTYKFVLEPESCELRLGDARLAVSTAVTRHLDEGHISLLINGYAFGADAQGLRNLEDVAQECLVLYTYGTISEPVGSQRMSVPGTPFELYREYLEHYPMFVGVITFESLTEEACGYRYVLELVETVRLRPELRQVGATGDPATLTPAVALPLTVYCATTGRTTAGQPPSTAGFGGEVKLAAIANSAPGVAVSEVLPLSTLPY